MQEGPFTVREATEADLQAVVALLADDDLGRLREDPRAPLALEYLQAFKAIAADRNQLLAVMEAGDAVIGTLQISILPGISRRGAWSGQIKAVRIAAPWRGRGLGQRLVAWAIGECRARGCRLVQLTTDKSRRDAHRFYEKCGFVASHQGYKMQL